MAASTASYFGFNFVDAKLQYDVAGTLTEVDVLFANTMSISPEEENIQFDGDGQRKILYVLTGMTIELSPDALNVAAASVLFGKNEVTASIPTGLAALTWFGDVVEAGGKSVGFWAEGSAIKSVAGVESTVGVRLWVPLGTLTLGAPGDIETAAKWGQQVWRIAAVRTSVDVAGDALPSVPAGGAFYAIAEKS